MTVIHAVTTAPVPAAHALTPGDRAWQRVLRDAGRAALPWMRTPRYRRDSVAEAPATDLRPRTRAARRPSAVQ